MGELAAVATAVCWSFTSIFFSYSGRRVGSDVVNRVRLLLAILYISLAHLAIQGTLFPWGTESWRWGWLALSSILGLALGDGALFYAYVLIGPRLSQLVMASVPIMSAFFAWLAFGETLTSVEMLGVGLAVAGMAWVITERQPALTTPEQSRQYGLGLLMALGGALGQTANLIFARYALVGNFSALSATEIRLVVGAVVLWGWSGWRGEVRPILAKLSDRRALGALAGGALVGPFLGIWLSLLAIQTTRVGVAATLMALPPVILIPLAYLFFGERTSLRGLTGTLVAFVGVGLLLWLE